MFQRDLLRKHALIQRIVHFYLVGEAVYRIRFLTPTQMARNTEGVEQTEVTLGHAETSLHCGLLGGKTAVDNHRMRKGRALFRGQRRHMDS